MKQVQMFSIMTKQKDLLSLLIVREDEKLNAALI
jgi:hypothetical protein